ncbi:unnamed protein product [Candidatus Protochlamydia amoebophila UWE25]|uniref:Tyr recombinase domain-containing protein n=2 Tax=Candidatus Protochlamydia amoebophila TaxID=362787 RepID=A0A2P9H9X0_PARUW|nr:unnamed protein product [Candidatus Protochlamydia amoebophila UWE25]
MENQLAIQKIENFEVGEYLDLVKTAKEYATFARSFNTNKSYRSDWDDFVFWCQEKNLRPLPALPQTIVVYLISRADNAWINQKGKLQKPLKISSLSRRLTSISQAHKLAKQPFDKNCPEIQEVWKGIKNKLGSAQIRKDPILLDDLRKMIESINNDNSKANSLSGMRDKALLLLGFVGAFRRSELVSLTIDDIKFVREGLQITLRKSKTDQEGKERIIAIPYGSNILTCPVRTLNDWLDCSKISEGLLFRPINRHGQIMDKALTSKSVALIIKRNKHLENQKNSFSGHSLRAGFATTAAIFGVPEHLIMKQTGHKSFDTIRRYI